MTTNPITATVPFDLDGVHHGHLRLPHSHDSSAWGNVMIPITVIRNGSGPTALLTGANHGDEYEGPIALFDLAFSLEPEMVKGRVIIVPAFNQPAFQSATRTSPFDGKNLNRVFPGNPKGSVTEKIADYFQRYLIPMADAVLDFHSGGKTLDFVPFACAHELNDKRQETACVEAMQAFNAPYSMKLLEIDSVGMYDSAVEEQGKVFVSTELGGGGTATAASTAIARKGVRNFLIHTGILKGSLSTGPTIHLDMPGGECFIFSEHAGLIEPMVDLGDPVHAGQTIARVWSTHTAGQPPAEYSASISGLLAARHFPGLIKPGDCLGVVAVQV